MTLARRLKFAIVACVLCALALVASSMVSMAVERHRLTDDPLAHTGPVLDRGRIGLRLMYGTRMYFRNLRIWNRGGPTGPTGEKP
jgi:hypothetical protein